MKKRSILFLITILICFSFIVPIALTGELTDDVVVSLEIDNPLMEVNGEEKEIDLGMGTVPVIKNGRTLVPIRAIIEAFGGVVKWEQSTKTATLLIEDDVVELVIDQNIAYYNNEAKTLDVAPAIINERTMLPIRFIAESFNFGVAWDGETGTIYIVKNTFEDSEYELLMDLVPEYSNKPYVKINNNKPFFDDYEIIPASFEYYSNLDDLGRCDVCMASVAEDIMPTEKRGSISSVKPTGWINKKYENVDGEYLYNRCHLIGFQLTGENANKRNLITGTRYLNVEGMLPFEDMIDDYIEDTSNHVMYRVTPVFSGDNLVADGVLLEAYSVEDRGRGIEFCVYCYNVQPDIFINYKTGENWSR